MQVFPQLLQAQVPSKGSEHAVFHTQRQPYGRCPFQSKAIEAQQRKEITDGGRIRPVLSGASPSARTGRCSTPTLGLLPLQESTGSLAVPRA